jgi:hypothetical protein
MASYSSFTKTRSPVLGICILTLTTLYKKSFSLNALPVYTTLVSGGGLPSGQYTGTIILVRHGENALNEYSPLVCNRHVNSSIV